jgi:hypothetical protein
MDDWRELGQHYDRDGNPISFEEWGAKFDSMEYKVVDRWGEWDAEGELVVSTVWMGINHRFGPGPPLIFETMIFGEPYHNECMRYATESEAREGHRRSARCL